MYQLPIRRFAFQESLAYPSWPSCASRSPLRVRPRAGLGRGYCTMVVSFVPLRRKLGILPLALPTSVDAQNH